MFVLQIIAAVVTAFLAATAYQNMLRLLSLAKNNERRQVESLAGLELQSTMNSSTAKVKYEAEEEEAWKYEQEMNENKNLYYKLHNLEQYPDVLPQCWSYLTSLLSKALTDALSCPSGTILEIQKYSPEALKRFLLTKNTATTQKWEAYLARRKLGGPREMFSDLAEAKWWLKQAAPLKFVDGAWLGHTNKAATPFRYRNITKNTWQVLSEELGDGDLNKNHVKVYQNLMKDIDARLPEAYSRDFIHPRHQLNEGQVWKAAISQLLISLFPQHLLPEILGFNMAYESLPLHLLQTVKELEELKLNAYYFLLHISIDNTDSGHAAMAMAVAIDYIEQTRQEDGEEAAATAWKRVQAGYTLAESLPTTPQSVSLRAAPKVKPITWTAEETAVVKIFRSKAAVAHGIHCRSALRFGGHTISEWLEPNVFNNQQHQKAFLQSISNSRPLIIRGNSAKSRLTRELSWEGKMFGSFTQAEVDTVKKWIDSLDDQNEFESGVYYGFIGSEIKEDAPRYLNNHDVSNAYPVFENSYPSLQKIRELRHEAIEDCRTPNHYTQPPGSSVSLGSKLMIANQNLIPLMPLWFASTSLLESFVNIPARISNRAGSLVVKILRAQYGFEPAGPGVAGMDEVRRTSAGEAMGLVEIGLEIWRTANNMHEIGETDNTKIPVDLAGAIVGIDAQASKTVKSFAIEMLNLSMRYIEHHDVLIGLAWAFMELHEVVAANTTILKEEHNKMLADIAARERSALEALVTDMYAIPTEQDIQREEEDQRYLDFLAGQRLGKTQIYRCMSHSTC
ncbi:hypothetical protein QQS21_002050 [Conoideocrella luteorostrata]|uniref:Uncharacterized protein n=1 Tax=Conoideocrella luteorostrata TaxID=1105319 RepID=A0AAJ0CYG6_9HYPO|nr:hypothetical protein QQS21_002050 [Conoideocrella luteorostrata]